MSAALVAVLTTRDTRVRAHLAGGGLPDTTHGGTAAVARCGILVRAAESLPSESTAAARHQRLVCARHLQSAA